MPISPRVYTGLTAHLPDAVAHPWIFDCDADGCYWLTAHADIATAELARDTHKCPTTGETRTGIDMPTLINKMWELLDEATAVVLDKEETTEDERNKARGRARGVAECLQIMCTPYYPTVNDVTRQAVKRYKMAKGEIEFEETPGAAGYNPAPAGSNPRVQTKPAPQSIFKDKPELTEKKLAGLKRGIAAGFARSELSSMYGVSLEYIAGLANEMST